MQQRVRGSTPAAAWHYALAHSACSATMSPCLGPANLLSSRVTATFHVLRRCLHSFLNFCTKSIGSDRRPENVSAESIGYQCQGMSACCLSQARARSEPLRRTDQVACLPLTQCQLTCLQRALARAPPGTGQAHGDLEGDTMRHMPPSLPASNG